MDATPIAVALTALLAPTRIAEIDVIDAYLAPYDTPAPHGQHCARTAGMATTAEAPGLAAAPGTNALLDHHLQWHLARYALLEDGRPPVDEASPYGTEFVTYHRDHLATYDAWRIAQGLDPVVAWDPATPVPDAFRYDKPGCSPREDEDPRFALPTWATPEGGEAQDALFGRRALCEFASLNEFAKALDWGYHHHVHGAVGGDMGPVWTSPRDPLFWAWHRHVDDVFASYERACAVADATEHAAAASMDARAVPLPGGLVMGALGAAAAGLRKRDADDRDPPADEIGP